MCHDWCFVDRGKFGNYHAERGFNNLKKNSFGNQFRQYFKILPQSHVLSEFMVKKVSSVNESKVVIMRAWINWVHDHYVFKLALHYFIEIRLDFETTYSLVSCTSSHFVRFSAVQVF